MLEIKNDTINANNTNIVRRVLTITPLLENIIKARKAIEIVGIATYVMKNAILNSVSAKSRRHPKAILRIGSIAVIKKIITLFLLIRSFIN